jgi:hypothetical protein
MTRTHLHSGVVYMNKSGELEVTFYFTHHSSPHWPWPSVYYHKGGRYMVSSRYSQQVRDTIEDTLDGK